MFAILTVGITHREVSRVVRHRILASNIHLHIVEGNTLDDGTLLGIIFDGVFFSLCLYRFEGIRQFDIFVERIIVGADHLFRVGIIERDAYFSLVGEEFTQFD